eukprot:jgi/Mesvir1/1177/Mv17674-RA.1
MSSRVLSQTCGVELVSQRNGWTATNSGDVSCRADVCWRSSFMGGECLPRLIGGSQQSVVALRSRHRTGGSGRLQYRASTEMRSSMRLADMSSQMRDVRKRMEDDEQLSTLMRGLRGQNLNDQAFASDNVNMRLVDVSLDDIEDLPLVYDHVAIAAYWSKRPGVVAKRVFQLVTTGWSFLSGVAWDIITDKLQENEVKRAVELREIVTSFGPAYIKLGQALSIRPDVLSPKAMQEMQKLCDKVPSFDNAIAMDLIKSELGAPHYDLFAELSPDPIAAASLGQVYKGRLKSGEVVAVKVQRPFILETVTIDLFILRKIGLALRQVPQIATDVVGLVDEWAARFFEELDYTHEGNNAMLFAEQMAQANLHQVVVPRMFKDFTSRRVLTSQWLDGEKLSSSTADDVGTLVNLGVVCYLTQLLETGLFHADPHPGNLIRTPDGRLAILDFGLMTEIDDEIKYGMIEAISHLMHRDYELIVEDFVKLQFIPEGVDLSPILPVLAKVFDQALEGGGAKNINFQELAADLAQITFDYPFRIPPYFALIIRAIGVLEGIALVGNPEFAIVDEAYPYIAQRLLTDKSDRLRAALKYTIYGKENVLNVERLLDVLEAFESFGMSSRSAMGDLGKAPTPTKSLPSSQSQPLLPSRSSQSSSSDVPATSWASTFPLPLPGSTASTPLNPFGFPPLFPPGPLAPLLPALPGAASSMMATSPSHANVTREALRFIFSPQGEFFRELVIDELVKSIDALSRRQLMDLVRQLGIQNMSVPVLIPGAVRSLRLAPQFSSEDEQLIMNLRRITDFLAENGGNSQQASSIRGLQQLLLDPLVLRDLLPYMGNVATDFMPRLLNRLLGRMTARFIKEVFV